MQLKKISLRKKRRSREWLNLYKQLSIYSTVGIAEKQSGWHTLLPGPVSASWNHSYIESFLGDSSIATQLKEEKQNRKRKPIWVKRWMLWQYSTAATEFFLKKCQCCRRALHRAWTVLQAWYISNISCTRVLKF